MVPVLRPIISLPGIIMKNRPEVAEEKSAPSPSASVDKASATDTTGVSFEERREDCPLCGSGGISPHHTITRYSRHFTVDRCGACGFIFMNPRFTDGTIRGFYGEEYYRGSAEYAYHDERRVENSCDLLFCNAQQWQPVLHGNKRHDKVV